MRFAVNYSRPLAKLVTEGKVHVDLYKMPAWPQTVAEVRQLAPTYVHFPLLVSPDGVMNGEQNALADWAEIEALLAASDTPFVNIHLAPKASMYPQIPANSLESDHIEQITADAINAVNTAVQHFGADRIIVENTPDAYGLQMLATTLPEVISRVITETNAGLLFDISHARLAAHELQMDIDTYIDGLPTEHTREIHITGLQRLDQPWLDRLEAAGFTDSMFHHFAGKLVDHLPMTDDDWTFYERVLAQLHNGSWQRPEIVSLEYGGIGGVWEALADRDVLLKQVPRLRSLLFAHDLA